VRGSSELGHQRDSRRFGHIARLHLDFRNTSCHAAFDLGAWLYQPTVVIESPFLDVGFEAIRAIGRAQSSDRVEQDLV